MKNKSLISLVIIVLIGALTIMALITKYSYSKASESNIASIEEVVNEIQDTNEVENETEDITEEISNIQEDIVLVSDKEMTPEADTIQQKSVSSKAEEQKQSAKVTQEKKVESPKQQEEQKASQTETKIATQKQEIQEQQQTSKSETNIQQPETPKCTDTKHAVGVGNSNKWFSSKSEAISYYNSQISYWGKLWENFEIDDDVYYKNCPTRI